ncbi:hypothetical protein BX589_101268 [Paraburkholderia fungorum]|jgi:hypothetical protein|nr:hypothetical protein BX589_101268 [Paraburkholderia fungorum]
MYGEPRRRGAFLDVARAYATSRIPTDSATHALCTEFVEMLARDRGERVVLHVGPVVIARSSSNTKLSSSAR